MRKAASRCIRRRAFALLALVAFTATIQAPSAGAASKKVPSRTSGITVTQSTAVSVSISWQRVRTAAGYDLYLDGARIGKTQATAYTFANLRCGATYTLGVDAFNNKGVRSSIVSLLAPTSACPAAVVGNDTSSPTLPTSLTQGATTASSISLLWTGSLDNFGVAGYELFLNGNRVGTTAMTTYTFATLSCGTSYALAVDAFDAAGNRSPSAMVEASTSPCADTSPPTIPAVPTQTGSTATSISLLWAGSLDNVGVAGYELFLNGNRVGTTTATSYTFANLSCGTSYALAIDAFDAAGNRSQPNSLSATTNPCSSVAPNSCTSTLSPSTADTLDTQVNDPAKGSVVCLHGGGYSNSSAWTHFTRSGTATTPLVVKSYPGETATIHGQIGIDSSYFKLVDLNINHFNTVSGGTVDCVSNTIGGAFILAGSNITLDHDDIYTSPRTYNGLPVSFNLFVQSSVGHETITHNKIHDAGGCKTRLNGYDHGVYVGHGSGTVVDHNWIYNDQFGSGIQVYPDASGTRVFSNVIDGSVYGVGICSTGNDNDFYNNVVINSIGGTSGSGPGAMISGCGPQGGSTGNEVYNNDQWNNPGGLGSVSGITYSDNISADPGFVDPGSHDYQISPASPVLQWGLWTGS
jgi:chitodextrinase